MNKIYNQAPLPFMGQKRKFLKRFREELAKCPPTAVYVDLFGGSGLLSRTVKDTYPKARVVYNDFDNYSQRIENIPATNRLLEKIRKIAANEPKDVRIAEEVKSKILKVIEKEKGFVDYITLSGSLLFSMNYVTSFEALKKEKFYNVIKQSDYNADGYLDGLEVVRMHYKELFNLYKGHENLVLLIDPPYLSTETGTYSNNGYWKLGDYLDVLSLLNSHNYFYFTSNKSQILELCEWMSNHSGFKNPFNSGAVSTTTNTMNYASSYTDIMVFKEYSKSV